MKTIQKVILVIILIFTISSCSKDENNSPEPIVEVTISPEKTQYQPLEIVSLKSSADLFAGESIQGKINGIDIILQSNENIASFVLPNLPNGNYTCTFNVSQKNYSIPIVVVANANINTPEFYFNEIKTIITDNIDSLTTQIDDLPVNTFTQTEMDALNADIIKYTNLQNNFSTSYNNLSAEEKLVFAKCISANKYKYN